MFPTQVHSAPSVDIPDKPAQQAGFHPMPLTEVISDSSANTSHRTPREEELRREQAEETANNLSANNSPSQPKLIFGLKKQNANSNSNQLSKLEGVFTSEENDAEEKPKKKLVPIDYSDDEMPVDSRDGRGYHKRRRDRNDSDRGGSDDSRSPKSQRSRHSSSSRSGGHRRDDRGGGGGGGRGGSAGDNILIDESVRDRKLTPDERKRVVQQLVNNIPTSKEEVFEYQLKWSQIDKVCARIIRFIFCARIIRFLFCARIIRFFFLFSSK